MVSIKDDRLLLQFAFHELLKSHEVILWEKEVPPKSLLFRKKYESHFSDEGPGDRLLRYISSLSFRDEAFHKFKCESTLSLEKASDAQGIIRSLKKMGRFLLSRTLTLYDENLTFFLLRKEKELNHLLGREVLKNELFSLFASKKDLATWLLSQYQSRGFESLFSHINQTLKIQNHERAPPPRFGC